MHINNRQPHLSITLLIPLISICLIIVVLSVSIFQSSVHAQATQLSTSGPTMHINAGFDSRYRDGNWIPIQITLQNDGPNFTGKISVNTPALYGGVGNNVSTSRYQRSIVLPTGAQKQITLYIPVSTGGQGTTQNLTIDLLDGNNQKISSQVSTLRSLGPGDAFIGVLSDQTSGFSRLSQVTLPTQAASTIVEPLNATTMPTQGNALNNFDLIIVDNFTTSTLNHDQLTALQNWVNKGGTLVLAGGPEWHRTLSPLPENLLPITITGTRALAPNTNLLPIGSAPNNNPTQHPGSSSVPQSVTISTATARPDSTTLLSADNTPLIVQDQRNMGRVYYLAFDPALDPLTNWQGITSLWQGLLIRSLGDQLLSTNQNTPVPMKPLINDTGSWQSLLQSLFPNAFPPTWLILGLLLGYLLLLGPVRFALVKIFKRRDWSWRIALATIALFSVLTYGLALQQKGSSIISSSISVIRLDQTTTSANATAHITRYTGIFVPSQGNFLIHMAGNDSVKVLGDQFRSGPMLGGSAASANAPQQTTITTDETSTDVNLQGVDIWTIRSLVSTYDTQFHGGIASQLMLQDNTLSGTVTNTLPYPLQDAYALIGNQFVSLGTLGSGQTAQVNLVISGPQGNSTRSLADQIAASRGLPIPYGPYYNGPQSQNVFQRHMALLSTLSSENNTYNCGNGPCPMPVGGIMPASMSSTYSGGGQSQNLGRDPLLLQGTPATLIGWADNAPDISNHVTLNGNTSPGTQEALIQAPLNVEYAHAIHLPASVATGQLIDVQDQGNTIQMLAPSAYSMTTGSMTFEFSVPGLPKLQSSSMTISEVQNLNNMLGQGGNNGSTIKDASNLHTYLYNWQTNSWDQFSLNQLFLTLNNAQPYIGTDGRVLVQFANQDTNQGTIFLSRPTLELQGTTSR